MPELPEVQTMVDDLNDAGLTGAIICEAQVYWERTIANTTSNEFCQRIRGLKLERLSRRAKYIVFELSGGYTLLVHLRMTGRFELSTGQAAVGRHVHVVIDIGNQRRLMFYDTRKFGRLLLTRNPNAILDALGPEPLDNRFTAKLLADRLRHRRRQIKPLILDQRFIAGIGNIYADEALWRSRIHPLRRAHTLTADEIIALHRAIRYVLRQGIRNGGTTLGAGRGNFKSVRSGRGRNATLLKVFRRTGAPCPRCRRPIDRIIVGQRSTHICDVCQQNQ